MRFFYLILFILYSEISFGQKGNLISNPSFEEFYQEDGWERVCPFNWELTNSVDYFSTEYEVSYGGQYSKVTAPNNFAGYQNAQDGNAYLGFIYLYPEFKVREFVSTKLIKPLEEGEIYDVEFYVSLSDSSKYNACSVAFWFSKRVEPFVYKNRFTLDSQNPIVLEGLDVGKEGWRKVSYLYTAIGNEEYFTIGNCKSCISRRQYRNIIKRKNGFKEVSEMEKYSVYYYLDNVSVTPHLAK
jgi:hypothetical protein